MILTMPGGRQPARDTHGSEARNIGTETEKAPARRGELAGAVRNGRGRRLADKATRGPHDP